MNKKTLLLTVGALSAVTLSETASATSMEQRMRAMERKMEQLQHKLEKTETENQQLKEQLIGNKPLSTVTPVVRSLPAELANTNAKLTALETRIDNEKTAATKTSKDAPKLEVSSKGMSFKSSDDNYKFSLRGYAQMDSNFYLDDTDTNADKFTIRRARVSLEGTLFKAIDFRIAPDFAGSQARLFDAFADVHYFPQASLMFGKFRQPVSLERMQSAPNLTFIERGYPAQLAPNRDLGVMLHGAIPYPGYKAQYNVQPIFKEFFGYEVGVFQGVRDAQAVQEADKDNDNNKEIAARVFSHPFMHTDTPLKGLGVGVAGTWGQPKNNALTNLVSDGQQKILTYNTGVVSTGDSYRVYPQMYWYWKGFGMIGEYLLSSQHLQNGAGTPTVRQNNTAWQVNASYVLTGEENSFFGIKPAHPFDPSAGTWGAWQIAARWSELNVDNNTFTGGFADPAASVSKEQSWALGLNWILNDNVKFMTNYEQTLFSGGAANGLGGVINRPLERALFTRFQIAF